MGKKQKKGESVEAITQKICNILLGGGGSNSSPGSIVASAHRVATQQQHAKIFPTPTEETRLFVGQSSDLVVEGCPAASTVAMSFEAGSVHSDLGRLLKMFALSTVDLFTKGPIESVCAFSEKWPSLTQSASSKNHFELQGFGLLFSFIFFHAAQAQRRYLQMCEKAKDPKTIPEVDALIEQLEQLRKRMEESEDQRLEREHTDEFDGGDKSPRRAASKSDHHRSEGNAEGGEVNGGGALLSPSQLEGAEGKRSGGPRAPASLPPPRDAPGRNRRALLDPTTAALSDRLAAGDIAVAQIVELNPLVESGLSLPPHRSAKQIRRHYYLPPPSSSSSLLLRSAPDASGGGGGAPTMIPGMDVPPLSLIAFVNRKALPESSSTGEAPAWRSETFDPRYPVLSARQTKEERLHHELSLQAARRTRSSSERGGVNDAAAVSARACKDYWAEKDKKSLQGKLGVEKVVSYHERDLEQYGREMQRLREEVYKELDHDHTAAEAILDADLGED